MAEYILNLLPVTEEEKAAFRRQPPGPSTSAPGGAL